MKNEQSKTAIKNWKFLKDNIVKKTPNFLISKNSNPIKSTIKITKSDDSEIVINCDDNKHETIPDSVFNYLCNLNNDVDSGVDNDVDSGVDNNVNNKNNKRKTKSIKPKIVGKKTRKKL